MRRGTRTRNGAARTLATAAVAVLLAAGCTAQSGPRDDGRGTVREPASSPESRNDASVLAVKVDNVRAARPQSGLDAADLVYVEPVEGGLSRLMAVYATRLPDSVGPVRSARESDLELLRQFDRPTLAFSGAQSKLLPLIAEAPLRAEPADGGSDAYVRDDGRAAPHNLYLRPDRLMPSAPGAAALTTGFRYGAAPSGGTAEDSHTVRYPAARFTFSWSESRDRWLVSMDGEPAVTADGKRLAPATVVVQYVDIRDSRFQDFRGSNSPYVESVGTGKAEVLRDGRVHTATWQRPAAEDGTSFEAADGSPMRFADGQVWVVFTEAP
ncbi:DUF3048 domain-containing protein [Streptomyces sp. HMX87]|uniref:DUF3048 domain-containing protein n=1 Tax=Streptomyces sp. HMX87 TaxID=3390849 RepID=UPI003A86CF67